MHFFLWPLCFLMIPSTCSIGIFLKTFIYLSKIFPSLFPNSYPYFFTIRRSGLTPLGVLFHLTLWSMYPSVSFARCCLSTSCSYVQSTIEPLQTNFVRLNCNFSNPGLLTNFLTVGKSISINPSIWVRSLETSSSHISWILYTHSIMESWI